MLALAAAGNDGEVEKFDVGPEAAADVADDDVLLPNVVVEFVITFNAVFIASEVGVPLFIGGVGTVAGGGSCCVSTFSCCIVNAEGGAGTGA